MNAQGVLSVKSIYPVGETTSRLENVLQRAGATIYARIDQQDELKKVGLTINSMEFLLFGNPVAGGTLIVQNPLIALDLPLKLLISENDQHETWIIYNDAAYIAGRYGLQHETYQPLYLDKIIHRALL